MEGWIGNRLGAGKILLAGHTCGLGIASRPDDLRPEPAERLVPAIVPSPAAQSPDLPGTGFRPEYDKAYRQARAGSTCVRHPPWDFALRFSGRSVAVDRSLADLGGSESVRFGRADLRHQIGQALLAEVFDPLAPDNG